MRSSKIKNIIILMLLLVNAFLLVLVGGRSWNSRQALRETGERMVAILERNGVEFLPREVPGKLELPPRRAQAVPLDREGAALLLGQVKQMEDGRVRTRFVGTMGTAVTTTSGEVEVQFLPGSGSDEAAGLDLLEQLGVTVEETGRSREGDVTTVLARQLWEGSPMPDAVVVMTLRGEELESLSFRRMVPTGEAPAAGETITAATALARFLEELNQEGYVCSQVREMYPGYSLSGTTAVTLAPTWYVETDAWPWRFAVDGVTGQVSAADNG